MGKHSRYEYECIRTRVPTGTLRVRVAVFGCTSFDGMFITMYLNHFQTKLDDLRCVRKVFLTSFQTISRTNIITKWTTMIVSALIHVEALISSL